MKINVKEYLDIEYEKLQLAVSTLEKKPKLVTVLIGDRKDSETYVRNKEKCIARANMVSETVRIPDGTPLTRIAQQILELNFDKDINGILLQLPLNREYYSKDDENKLINLIDANKDVDGLTLLNQGKLFIGLNQKNFLTPCTPSGIVKLLKHIHGDLTAKDVTVIGRSQLLGNSLAQMLMREDANVTMLHSKSKWYMQDYLNANSADILCLCAGSYNLLYAEDLNPEEKYTIIDAAINVESNGKLRGDLCKEDYEVLDEDCDVKYTPVPGGVGLLTTYTLAYNLYKAYCLQKNISLKNI